MGRINPPPTRATIELAREVLRASEFEVWLTKHVANKGRRTGSLHLGITEDAWRYRIVQADRKVSDALRVAA